MAPTVPTVIWGKGMAPGKDISPGKKMADALEEGMKKLAEEPSLAHFELIELR
jgi:hypothetical protein